MIYDVIIIGKGPAGISASLYVSRANLKTLIIGKEDSELSKAREIENYYGFEKPISGQELLNNGIKQAKKLGIDMRTEEVVGISHEEMFSIKTVENEYKSKSIIIATGTRRFKPKIKGIKEYEGKGISYCAICDGFFHRNKDVAVLGNGDYAISEALELVELANSVTILTNGENPKEVRNSKIKFSNKQIKEFRGDSNQIRIIEFEDSTKIYVSGVFIAEGTATSLDLAKKIGVETEGNNIIVDIDMNTNISGIFACGDATGGLLQISKAVYEGAKAGLSAIKFLKNDK